MENERIDFLSPLLKIQLKSCMTSKGSALRGMHFHNAIEIVYVEEGRLLCSIGNLAVAINKNAVLFINSDVTHELICDEYAKFTYYQIDAERYLPMSKDGQAHYLYSYLRRQNTLTHKIFYENAELNFILDDIKTEFESKKECYESYINADIYRLCAIFQREGLLSHESTQVDTKAILRLLPAIKYIEENFSSKLLIDDVSRSVYMDKFYFCKFFKKALGTTFTQYILFVRICEAQHLLLSTNQSVEQISEKCGFHSVQYFNRCFKKLCNCTPKAYRAMNATISF